MVIVITISRFKRIGEYSIAASTNIFDISSKRRDEVVRKPVDQKQFLYNVKTSAALG